MVVEYRRVGAKGRSTWKSRRLRSIRRRAGTWYNLETRRSAMATTGALGPRLNAIVICVLVNGGIRSHRHDGERSFMGMGGFLWNLWKHRSRRLGRPWLDAVSQA